MVSVMRKSLCLLVVMVAVLAACTSIPQQYQYQASPAEVEHRICSQEGAFPSGSKEYKECRADMARSRAESNARAAERRMAKAQCANEAQTMGGCQAHLFAPQPSGGIQNYGLSSMRRRNAELDMQNCVERYIGNCLAAQGY